MAKERTKLTKKLDGLCRNIIRIMYDNKCYRCGLKIEGQNSHPCHIIAKGNGASWRRFDLNNIFLGCFKCHRWWHDNPVESGKWFDEQFSPARKKLLEKYKYGKPCPISTGEMKELIVEYKDKLKLLERE